MVVNYTYGDLFKKDTVDKQLSIVSDDGKINITNTELHQEKFELTPPPPIFGIFYCAYSLFSVIF